jgi:DNA-binding transcriptional LysR family regulator
MISLRQMEALYWIAQLGTFERAAARLNTTQSAITKRIKELEATVRVEIFDRSQRSARLTGSGEELLALAEEMLSLQQRVLNLRKGQEAPVRYLRLGVTELTALTWLPRYIGGLRAAYPGINIDTEVGMSRDLFDKLQDDELDLFIGPEAFKDRSMTIVPLVRNKNVWMGSPKLIKPLKRHSMAELAEYPILIQGNRSGSGVLVSNWFKSDGTMVPRFLSCDSLVALLGMAIAGLGVTYLPQECFDPLVREGKLRVIETNPELPAVPYVAMYRHDKPSAFVAAAAELAQKVCDFSKQWQ